MKLWKLGARLGAWNDARSSHDRRVDASFGWRLVDRLASWLYVRQDRRMERQKRADLRRLNR